MKIRTVHTVGCKEEMLRCIQRQGLREIVEVEMPYISGQQNVSLGEIFMHRATRHVVGNKAGGSGNK